MNAAAWLRRAARAEDWVLTVSLAAMMVLPLLEAVLRKVAHTGISGQTSIEQHLVLITGMLGGASSVDVGIGSDNPFGYAGGSGVNPGALASHVQRLNMTGVNATPYSRSGFGGVKLAIENVRFVSFDTEYVPADRSEADSLTLDFADQRPNPEEVLTEKEELEDVERIIDYLLARLKEAGIQSVGIVSKLPGEQ